MAEFDRLYNLGRAYANKGKDMIFAKSDEQRALDELNEALDSAYLSKQVTEHSTSNEMSSNSSTNRGLPTTEEESRIVLGVPTNSAYGHLIEQRDLLLKHLEEFTARYPDRIEIAKHEKNRIERAFQILSSKADPTEKRFGSLEIE